MSINIKKIIINKPYTIIYFDDGSKTVVKCGSNDVWDTEKGIAVAIAKRAMGNKSTFNQTLCKMVEDAEHPKPKKKVKKYSDTQIAEMLNQLFESIWGE